MPTKATIALLKRVYFAIAHLTAIGFIALVFGFTVVWLAAGSDAVVTGSNLQGQPKTVPEGGHLTYTYDLEIHETCKGIIVTVFTSQDPGAPAVITLRRPAVYEQVGIYKGVKVDNDLPPRVTKGKWKIATSRESHCPTREWTDLLSTFDFEVQ